MAARERVDPGCAASGSAAAYGGQRCVRGGSRARGARVDRQRDRCACPPPARARRVRSTATRSGGSGAGCSTLDCLRGRAAGHEHEPRADRCGIDAAATRRARPPQPVGGREGCRVRRPRPPLGARHRNAPRRHHTARGRYVRVGGDAVSDAHNARRREDARGRAAPACILVCAPRASYPAQHRGVVDPPRRRHGAGRDARAATRPTGDRDDARARRGARRAARSQPRCDLDAGERWRAAGARGARRCAARTRAISRRGVAGARRARGRGTRAACGDTRCDLDRGPRVGRRAAARRVIGTGNLGATH